MKSPRTGREVVTHDRNSSALECQDTAPVTAGVDGLVTGFPELFRDIMAERSLKLPRQ